MKDVPKQKIRDLSPDARKPEQGIHIVRKNPAVLIDEHTARVPQILSLRPEKSARLHYLLELRKITVRHRLRRREPGEQLAAHDIDPRVRTLRREPPHHEQPPRVPLRLKRADSVRVHFLEPRDYFRGGFLIHFPFPPVSLFADIITYAERFVNHGTLFLGGIFSERSS